VVSSLRVGLPDKVGEDFVGRALREVLYEGARQAAALQTTWQSLAGKIDSRRHRKVAERLVFQVTASAKWRDQILEYFGQFSKRPIPQSI
jgi:alpha-glucuronidase